MGEIVEPEWTREDHDARTDRLRPLADHLRMGHDVPDDERRYRDTWLHIALLAEEWFADHPPAVPDHTVEALSEVLAKHQWYVMGWGHGVIRFQWRCSCFSGEHHEYETYETKSAAADAAAVHVATAVNTLAARAAAPDATHAPLDGGRRCTCGWPWDSMPRKAGDQAIHAAAAAPDALRVRIEALAAEWERDADERPAMPRRHIAQLRALLEDGAQ